MVHSNIFVIFLNLSFMVSGWVVYVRLKNNRPPPSPERCSMLWGINERSKIIRDTYDSSKMHQHLEKIVFHESIKYLHWLFLGGFLIFRVFFYRYFCPFRNFEGWANQEAYYQYILIVQ